MNTTFTSKTIVKRFWTARMIDLKELLSHIEQTRTKIEHSTCPQDKFQLSKELAGSLYVLKLSAPKEFAKIDAELNQK